METSESAKNVAVWSLLSALNYVHKCSKKYTAKKKSKKNKQQTKPAAMNTHKKQNIHSVQKVFPLLG